MTRMLWTAAFAAMAGSAFAAGNAAEDAKASAPGSARPERSSARPAQHTGGGVPGTVVFHGADGMVIRVTVPGAAVVPAHGAGAPASADVQPQARPNSQAPVGGGFTPEQ